MLKDYDTHFTSASFDRNTDKSKRRVRRKDTIKVKRNHLRQAQYQYFGYTVVDTIYNCTIEKVEVEKPVLTYRKELLKDGTIRVVAETKNEIVTYKHRHTKEVPIKPYAKKFTISGRKDAKKFTNRKVRHSKDLGTSPSNYRRVFDYGWYIA